MHKKLRLLGKIPFGLLLLHLHVTAPAQEYLGTFARNGPVAPRQQGTTYPLLDVLRDLEKKFGVIFDYNRKALKNKTVLIRGEDLKGKNLEDLLNTMLLPLDLTFERYNDRSYLIYSPRARTKAGQIRPGASLGLPGFGQETVSSHGNQAGVQNAAAADAALPVQVSGRVVSADKGEGLPGVNVLLKGSASGTTTNADGRYNIAVPDANAVLVFSYIGFLTREVPLNGQTTLDVQLAQDVKALDEVVVVGYGTQQRRDLTGAIASVTAQQINAVPVTGLDQALQGRAAGVYVTQNSGAPGGGVSVRIRGIGTTGNNEPLYVIDGIPVFSSNENSSRAANGNGQRSNALNTINPGDIESIEVLKDASATAIYGARGANGVVLITTKRGKAGSSAIHFDTYYGVQQVRNRLDVLNAAQYATLSNEMRTTAGLPPFPQFSDPEALGEGTDWQAEIFRPAAIQNYQLSVSGGTEKTQYALSGGYFGQDGIIIGSDFNRYSLRINLDHQASRRFKVGNSLLISRTRENLVPTEHNSGMVAWALTQLPTIPVYNQDGTFAGPVGAGAGIAPNPVAEALTSENINHKTRLLGNVYGEYKLLEGLTFRTTFGLDLLYANQKRFNPESRRGDLTTKSYGEQFASNELIWLNENTLTFHRNFGGRHDFTALAGVTAQASRFEMLSGSRDQFISNQITELDGASTANQAAGSSAREWSLLSYLGRVTYALAGKYLFTGTVRADGSSRFGPGNRFGVFPSASVGWRLSEEAFMRRVAPVSDLKLRASYGVTGNQEIDLYTYATYVGFGRNYNFGNQVATGVSPANITNPDVRWESTTQADIGLDLGLWANRVTFTADYYVKNTNGMLVKKPVSRIGGSLDAPTVNIGKVSNRGLELALSGQVLTGTFGWTTDLNFSTNRNRLVSLGGGEPIIGREITRSVEGQPIGQFYGWVTDGIFQTDEQVTNSPKQRDGTKPGDVKFADLPDKDGAYNHSIGDEDRTFIGNPQPRFLYGLTNTFSFKGFDLSVFVQGVQGNDLYNQLRENLEGMAFDANQSRTTLDRWMGEGTGNGMPRAVAGDPARNRRRSDRYVEDGSYLRVRNVTLGYTVPPKVVQALRMQRVRIYVSAQNAFTFTRYSGLDPEVGSYNQSSLASGIDYGTYPVPRTLLAGLNLSF